MKKENWPSIARKLLRTDAGLPRRGISIRASHHVFDPENELEEMIDGVWGRAVQQLLPNCCPALRQAEPLEA